MNNAQFEKFKTEALQRENILRLDCLDPFKAMNFLKQDFISSSMPPSSDDVLNTWAKIMNVERYRDQAISSNGVRESLTHLFNIFATNDRDIWLPEDVYPFYWGAAARMDIKPHSFPTLPVPDFRPLDRASGNSVVLITNPITPLGRALNTDEINTLKNWLAQSKDRRLILDTVYSYSQKFNKGTLDLFETNQCIIVSSLSKAWLERGKFGILLAPKNDQILPQKIAQPSMEACQSALIALHEQQNLPDIQQSAFTQEWERLAPTIQKFASDFRPPQTGYFSTINVNHRTVLDEFNALVIPASVFGSKKKNISVVTCLYDIACTPK